MKKLRLTTRVNFIFVYCICSIFGIAPFYNFKKLKLIKQNLNKIWLVLLLIYRLLLIKGYFRWKYLEIELQYNLTTIKLLEHPSHLSFWMMPFTSALIVLVYTTKNWEEFLNKFMRLKRNLPLPPTKSRFLRPLVNFTFHATVLIYVYSVIDHVTEDSIIYKIWNISYSSFEEIAWLNMTIFVSELALSLKDRYNALNQKFVEVIRISIDNKFISSDVAAYITVKHIKKIRFYYREITDLVDRFNVLLGWHMFCLYTYTLVDTLAILNSLIIGGDLPWVAADSIELFVIIIYNIYPTMSCDLAVQESRKIIKVCYVLQDNFPNKSPIRQEIMEFAEEVKYSTPNFVSIGLFNIDRSIMLKMVTTITTYVIIVTQFNNCQ